MPPKADKIETEIRKLQRLEGNKSCADCSEKVPGYVDLTNNVFICTKCSGIHREFQFKVKGVSMSKFSEEDWAGLAGVGNEAFNRAYLARLNPREHPLPNGNDTNKLKEFIRQKYMDKKWHADGSQYHSSSFVGSPSVTTTSSTMTSHSGEDSGRISIKLQSRPSMSRRASTGGVDIKPKAGNIDNLTDGMDFLSMSSAAPVSTPQHDPFGGSSSSTFDPFAPSTASTTTSSFNHEVDAFGSAPTTSSAHHGAFDPFGSNSSTQHSAHFAAAAFDPFSSSPAPAVSHTAAAIDNFGNFSTAHDPFGATKITPPAKQHDTMPFILASPPPPTQAAPTTTAPAGPPAARNFSAFDDLLTESLAPAVASNCVNPFDLAPAHSTHPSNGAAVPPASLHGNNPFGGPAAPAASPAGFAPTPANVHPGYPAGYPGYPPHQQQQPQQSPQPNMGYPGNVPGGYYGMPPQPGAYPPYGYPGYPGYGMPAAPGMLPAGSYPGYPMPVGGVPPHQLAQHQPPPHQAPPKQPSTPATLDPFASMTSSAWTQAAAGPRPGAGVGASAPAPSAAAVAPHAVVPPPSNPTESVNPFDLF